MSVINKKPYIETVLSSITKENLAKLIGLVNGGEGNVVFKSYINTSYAFSTDDKGVKRIVLETKDKVFTGYLIYNNSHCVIVAYDSSLSQNLKIVKLDYANDKYELVNEDLTINEFRRLIEGRTTNLIVEANDVEGNTNKNATEILETIEIDGTVYSVNKKVKLWENETPNATFSNTDDIEVPNMSNFEYLILGFKHYAGNDRVVEFKSFKYSSGCLMPFNSIFVNGYFVSRAITLVNATTIKFTDGYFSGTGTTSDDACVPIVLYGVNKIAS